ncbi:MAG: proton-conducting transporter membrane subunit [Sulfurospirillum sp.]
MEKFITVFTLISFFTPLISAILVLGTFKKIDYNVYKISVFFSFVAVLLSFTSLVLFFWAEISSVTLFSQTLFSLYITPLSIVVTFFVSLVSLVIHLYSIKYMYDDEGYVRYFILLDLMIFVIFGLLSVGNIILIASFWHMMGVVLYFLLIHNFRKKQTYRYGFYTLFTHLLADIPFLIALYLIYNYYNTTDLKLFLDTVSTHKQLYFDGTDVSIASVIALFIMFAAIIKSAQFPFHIWLPFTLEGPNPISALMHAGIVNAGAFIANRFAPLFIHGEIALHIVLITGFITAILGSALMLMQNDIKKALAYSTVGQMGYMMLEIGAGAFALAIYHMMVHGIFKASLFLGSGGAIHEARNKSNIDKQSVFDIFFSKTKYKKPGFFEYLVFVFVIPAAVAIFIFSPLIKENSFDSTILFYLFAWVGGAQVVYTMYHSHKRFKALFFTTIGFALALFVYVEAEHFFGGILYPNRELFKALFSSASWSSALFFMIYGVVFTVVVLVWIFAYQKLVDKSPFFSRFGDLYDFIYRVFGREFYILDFCTSISKKMVDFAGFINFRMKY